jgi:hypothetical protein
MPVGFVATEVHVVRHDGVLVTTLGAPSTEADDFYVMVQHKDEFSEQDVKFGMRLPYIEYCGQGWSWYGHILAFSLRRNSVKVELDAEAAERMQNDGQIEVEFNFNEVQFQRLWSALQETFTGYAYYQDVA